MMNIVDRIKKLKKEKNAVILAHNYQLPEVQDIADFVGDSLGLSIEAARTDAAIIVFCGVHFMAETAKILSPQKIVLLPDKNAGCPMADMIDAEGLKSLQAKHPNAVTVCYVNTSAAVKAHCDYCCTSANALKIVQNILLNHKDKEIIFISSSPYCTTYHESCSVVHTGGLLTIKSERIICQDIWYLNSPQMCGSSTILGELRDRIFHCFIFTGIILRLECCIGKDIKLVSR